MENTTTVVEKHWIINNSRHPDPVFIYRTTLRNDHTGKIIPGSAVYSVEYNEENLNCFKTLAEARKYAKEW